MQIREEEKQISRNDLAKHLGVNQTRMDELISSGFLPLGVNDGAWYSSDLLLKLRQGGISPAINIKGKRQKYYDDTVRCELTVESDGIFLVSHDIDPSENDGMSDMIARYGIWSAQGLNNHVHLKDVVNNPIYQIFLADTIIEAWKKLIYTLEISERVVIYWNGSYDSTICIYLTDAITGDADQFLKNFDAQIGMGKLTIRHIP